MSEIRVDHPTDRPNFYIVHTPSYSVGFSYQTPIAFHAYNGEGWVVSENVWSQTTGKHLNWFDNGDKRDRLSSESFEARLAKVIA